MRHCRFPRRGGYGFRKGPGDVEDGERTDDDGSNETTFNYELECTDCSFETTVEGSFLDALGVADEHQEERGGSPVDHFVNVDQYGQR